MKHLMIPHTEQRLVDGSVVVLQRFPNTKWIVHNCWYTYTGQQYNGWHFCSIPSQTIIPMNARDLHSLTIVSNFVPGPSPNAPRPPKPPMQPGPVWPQPGKYPGPMIPPHMGHDHDHEHGHHPDHGPGPDFPGHGPHLPIPVGPHPERGPVRSPERYLGGVNYFQGQLVYMHYGDIYQATVDFRSSWKAPSLTGNFKKDTQSGYLVQVPASLSKEVGDALEQLDKEIDDINRKLDGLEEEFERNKIRKYLINFLYAFGTDEPTKEHADKYLAELDPPVEPGVGIFFKNLNKSAPTWRHVFTYYPKPNTSGKLIFVDDTVDTITTGPVVEDLRIEKIEPGTCSTCEKGGYRFTKIIRILETGETTVTETDYPLADIDDIEKLIKDIDTKVDKTVAGEGGFILQNASLEVRATRGPHTFLSLVKEYLSLEDGSKHTQRDEIKPVDWGIPTIQELEELDARVMSELEKKVDKSVTSERIVQRTNVTGTNDGFKIASTLLSLSDGSIDTAEQLITLLNMGAASQIEMDGLSASVTDVIAILDDLRIKGVQVSQV